MEDFTYEATPASSRVVRLTNVHSDATEEDICQHFQGYTVIDQIRAINPRVGTNSVLYVLFSTLQHRNAVIARSGNRNIRGRRVNIMAAPTGNYALNATQESFVRPGDTGTASAAADPLSAALNLIGSEFSALSITPKEGERLRRAQYQRIQEARDAIARQSRLMREGRERAEYNKKRVLFLFLQRRAEKRACQRGFQDRGSPNQPPKPALLKYRVSSPDPKRSEDPRNRLLLITDIPTEADNDEVITFLQDYRPESIDRAQIGGNWMVSALILMQTVEGRDQAAARLNGRMIQGHRVVMHTFSNLTQEVLDRVMNPGSSISDIPADLPYRSGVNRSPVPPPVRAPYVPFGIPTAPSIAPPASGPRVADAPVLSNSRPTPPNRRSQNNHVGPVNTRHSGVRWGRAPPGPDVDTTSEDRLLDKIMHGEGLLPELVPARSVTLVRENQTTTGDQGDNTASQHRRSNFHGYLNRVGRERAEEENPASDRVDREDNDSGKPENGSRGRSHGRGRGRGWGHGRGRGRGGGDDHGRGRGRGDGRGGSSRGGGGGGGGSGGNRTSWQDSLSDDEAL
ncbi:hypothetical protein G6011_03837 [Alternaria panax]|uniref:RRM domain-containing protein n=1 Tax=Alternaria panax TaxID=48097 RepID=A0AAD4IFX8_9PLEO|nr:hypothetical protein G6011_03837 [Alternaria panax]